MSSSSHTFRLERRSVLSPLSGPLLLEPGDDGRPVVPAVATELEVRDRAGPGLLPDPTDRDVQALCHLGGIEQLRKLAHTIAHSGMSSTPSWRSAASCAFTC